MNSRHRFSITLLFFVSVIAAQTNISGIINTYAKADSIYNSGSFIQLANNPGFYPMLKVLIIQMDGVSADTSNASAFGSITAINTAGNYEISKIKNVSGNTIELCSPLIRSYNANFAVQVVGVPEYSNAVVTAPLLAQPWNGNTGGVLVLNVFQSLNLQANIDLTGAGFTGGLSNYYGGVNCGQAGYVYPNTSINGMDKGKGVFRFGSSLSRGRGAPGNGGGGGNNHNAGGGGGSNFGNGGVGGNEWSGCGSVAINGGLGGHGLSYSNSLSRIYMGGGGGAGHTNLNGANTAGGHGGGIAIITASTIAGNNYHIKAQGENAPSLILNYDEGRGGGGGGGTVLLDVKSFSTNLFIDVSGGDGGNSNTCCAGPGGSGGGGVAWFSSGVIPSVCFVQKNPGNSGVVNNSTNYGSTAGTPGQQLFDLKIPIVDCAKIVAIAETDNLTESINLFPNPTDGKLTIRKREQNQLSVRITDVLGETIFISFSASGEIFVDLTRFGKGIYFIIIECENGTMIKRVIFK